MAKKKRVSLRLDSNEIAVVGTLERWEHLILIYEAYAAAAPQNEKESWLDSVAWVREWIEHAKSKEVEVEEEW